MSCAAIPLSQFVFAPLMAVAGALLMAQFIREPLQFGMGGWVAGIGLFAYGFAASAAAYFCK